MTPSARAERILHTATVEKAVFDLRPDYRALLLIAEDVEPGPSDAATDALLARAEDSARTALADTAVTDLPEVAAWRAAYQAFGAKPSRTRNSLEALLRRAVGGLPRVNRLTDIYNAVSVLHRIPLGGEDLDRYHGAPRLLRATGTEPFDTVDDGAPAVDHPEPGEVVWADDTGVTCRRWNWRQGIRTRLTDDSTSLLFVLDALDPVSDDRIDAAADDLGTWLSRLGPDVEVARRLLTP